MKKYVSYISTLLFLLCFTVSAMANEVIFINTYTYPISGIRLVNANTGQGFDLLESPLASKQGIRVHLENDDLWNLMAVDLNGSAIHFENIRLSDAKYIFIFPNGTLEIHR